MSKLEQLINEFCPDGVEYTKIKDAFQRLKGTPITAGKMKEIASDNGEIRVFAGGKTVINAKEDDIPDANIIRVPAVLVQSRGVIDVIYFECPFTFKNEMWAYTAEEKVTVKYLYYVLKDKINYFRNCASSMGSLPQISLSVTEELKIPLPPLPVQEEIVHVLDNLTELRAELRAGLTEELTARRQQYEYYRDRLLTFDDGVEWKTLNETAISISSGRNKDKSDSGKYPVFGSTGIIGYTNHFQYNFEQILVARVGANAGYVHKATGNYDVSDNTIIINIKPQYVLQYLYYMLQKINLNNLAKGGGQPLITAGELKKIIIPIPARSEQERIVDILDRFDKLCNDIGQKLSEEIKADEQQYEYYRNKLLTFKEKEVCADE